MGCVVLKEQQINIFVHKLKIFGNKLILSYSTVSSFTVFNETYPISKMNYRDDD